jgi:methionine synthase II (cobalamin-independent)
MTSSCTVHLVGSISQPDAESTFRTVAAHVGDLAPRIPDGEVGERFYWIQFQTFKFDAASGIERVGEKGFLIRDQFDVRPFRLTGEPVVLPSLGYADAAIESFATFDRLQSEGVIPATTRFQVSLPTPAGVIAAFFVPDDRAAIEPIYSAALLLELDRIQAAIPHEKLAIQWDVATEFAVLEQIEIFGSPIRGWWGDDYPTSLSGVVERLVTLGSAVAEDVQLGYHLCYGDVEEAHFAQPLDAGKLADVSAGLLRDTTRGIDWIHLPVPIERDDADYFAPLATVDYGSTALYLGLVHHEDGVEGALRRARAAQTSVSGFGIATECGFGRGPEERTAPLLDIHAELAKVLTAQ